MNTPILMPRLSEEMEAATLTRWLKREGDAVQAGEAVAEIETDKSTSELEAPRTGKLGTILVPEGTENVACGTPLASLVHGHEDVEQTNSDENSRPTASPSGPLTVREALRDAMAEEMRTNPDICLIGEQVGTGGGTYRVTEGLAEEFGTERVIDTPVTEHGIAGFAVGAAMSGLRPIVEFMTWNFAMQAIDQIVNSAAKTRYMSGGHVAIPIVFRGPNGTASRVGAQHAQNFAAWYSHIPGLKVIAPYDAHDAKALLKAAIRDPDPVVFLEHETLYGAAFEPDNRLNEDDEDVAAIGKARILKKGRDLTLITFSNMCKPTLEAAKTLAAENIEAEIIDLRTLRPLDRDTILQSARRTGRVIAIEEGWPQCGIAAEIGALVAEEAFADLKAPFRRVTAKDTPLPYAANLEAQALPNAQTIVAAARKLVAQRVTATRAIETPPSSTPSAPRTAEPYQLQTEIDVTDLIERSKSENIDWGVLLDDAARDALLPIVERDVEIRIQNLVHGGITSAVAIAMNENSGILTFGGIERKPVVRGDHIAPASMMAVTIMVVSSRLPANIAAQALRSLKNRLENNE